MPIGQKCTLTFFAVGFCVACKAWSTHRDHDLVGGGIHVVTFLVSDGMHQFHSKFTEGKTC